MNLAGIPTDRTILTNSAVNSSHFPRLELSTDVADCGFWEDVNLYCILLCTHSAMLYTAWYRSFVLEVTDEAMLLICGDEFAMFCGRRYICTLDGMLSMGTGKGILCRTGITSECVWTVACS